MSGRLRACAFLLRRGEELLEVTFYALTEDTALEYALAWATPRGWVVEGSA